MAYFGGSVRSVGDPGFFSTLGKIGRAVGRNLPVVGGPIRAVEGLFARGAPGRTVGRPSVPRIASPGPSVNQFFTPSQTAAIRTGVSMNGSSGCPKGMQPAKVYIPGEGYQRVGHCVKIRKRNPYNRAAARRAASRLKSLGTGLKTVKKSVREADTALSGARKSTKKEVHVKTVPVAHA